KIASGPAIERGPGGPVRISDCFRLRRPRALRLPAHTSGANMLSAGIRSMSDSSRLAELVARLAADIETAANPAELANAKARALGRDGALTAELKKLGALVGAEKAVAGRELNQAKQAIEAAVNARESAIAGAELHARLAQESIDVTLPGRGTGAGGLH